MAILNLNSRTKTVIRNRISGQSDRCLLCHHWKLPSILTAAICTRTHWSKATQTREMFTKFRNTYFLMPWSYTTCIMNRYNTASLKFSQWCWRCRPTGMWCCAIPQAVPDILAASESFNTSWTAHPMTQHHIPKGWNLTHNINCKVINIWYKINGN